MPKHIDEDSSSEESSEEETHSIAEPEQDQEPNIPPPSFPSLGVFSWLLEQLSRLFISFPIPVQAGQPDGGHFQESGQAHEAERCVGDWGAEHMENNSTFSLAKVNYLVLDEADLLLEGKTQESRYTSNRSYMQ